MSPHENTEELSLAVRWSDLNRREPKNRAKRARSKPRATLRFMNSTGHVIHDVDLSTTVIHDDWLIWPEMANGDIRTWSVDLTWDSEQYAVTWRNPDGTHGGISRALKPKMIWDGPSG